MLKARYEPECNRESTGKKPFDIMRNSSYIGNNHDDELSNATANGLSTLSIPDKTRGRHSSCHFVFSGVNGRKGEKSSPGKT